MKVYKQLRVAICGKIQFMCASINDVGKNRVDCIHIQDVYSCVRIFMNSFKWPHTCNHNRNNYVYPIYWFGYKPCKPSRKGGCDKRNAHGEVM